MSAGLGPLNEMYMMSNRKTSYNSLTVGFVVDTDDPQQMGRLRVLCPALNDPQLTDDYDINNIPWASYCSSFGGMTTHLQRGPEAEMTTGPVAYGMWNIPKIGAQVLMTCIDGDPNYRVWLGCLHSQFMSNTLPNGRHKVNNNEQDGPLSSTDDPIQPLYQNYEGAYPNKAAFEWKTRGADYQAAGINDVQVNFAPSDRSDVDPTELDGSSIRQGYAPNQILKAPGILDSQVFAWVTPGFHSISMDDRFENCRMRLRTTTGHQLLMDDTNERVLLSTNKSNVWVEMDSAGNLDIYSDKYMNFHSLDDMNFTSGGDIRFRAKGAIHSISDGDNRMEVGGDYHIKVTGDENRESGGGTSWSTSSLDLTTSSDSRITSGAGFDLDVAANANFSSGGNFGILSSGNILQTGSAIHLNGPPAPAATPATEPTVKCAFTTNRVPFKLNTKGETWSRGMLSPSHTDKETQSNSNVDYFDYSFFEFGYNDDSSNRIFLSEPTKRGKFWRR